MALKTAATNRASFGKYNQYAWLGTVYGSNSAWLVKMDGTVTTAGVPSGKSGQAGDADIVVAPAFDLDTSKIYITGNEIKLIS